MSSKLQISIPQAASWLLRLAAHPQLSDSLCRDAVAFSAWYAAANGLLDWPDDVETIQRTERAKKLSLDRVMKLLAQMNHTFSSSVRKSAVATPRGTAIRSAKSDERSVPKMNGSAPYLSWTGSHSELHRNDAPNFDRASLEPAYSSHPTRTMRTMIMAAANAATHLNAMSGPLEPGAGKMEIEDAVLIGRVNGNGRAQRRAPSPTAEISILYERQIGRAHL